MKLTIAVLFLFLAACATDAPVIKTVDRIVKVEVKVPCKIKKIDKPEMPTDKLKKEDQLDDKVAAATAELERRKAYEKELEAAVGECQ